MEAGGQREIELELGPLMTSKGVFRFSAQEWNGLDALQNQDFDEAERVFNLLLNDRDAPQSMRQRASAYMGLLHAARGVKTPEAGAITSVTPIIEPGRRLRCPPTRRPSTSRRSERSPRRFAESGADFSTRPVWRGRVKTRV